MTIKDLKIGETATITEVGGNGALRQHFLDMGLIQGTEVTVVKYAPMGDPVELRIHGYELTPVGAASLLVFCLLYTPCVAAVASVKRELGGRLAAGMVVWQCLIAWVAAFAVYMIAGLF